MFPSSIIPKDGNAEASKIETILNLIFKRGDSDKILASIDKDAYIYGWGDGKPVSLHGLVRDRDKKRALGEGSYEEIITWRIVYDGSLAVATYTTKYISNDDTHFRSNTITLRKMSGVWKVTRWHCSKIGEPSPEWR